MVKGKGILGIIDECLIECPESFFMAPEFLERYPAVKIPRGIAGVFGQVRVERTDCIIVFPDLQECKAKGITGFCVRRFNLKRTVQRTYCLGVFAAVDQGFSLEIPRRRKRGQDCNGLVKGEDGVAVVAEPCKGKAFMVLCFPVCGIDLEQDLKYVDCPFRAVDFFESQSLVIKGLDTPLV